MFELESFDNEKLVPDTGDVTTPAVFRQNKDTVLNPRPGDCIVSHMGLHPNVASTRLTSLFPKADD